MRLSQMVFPMLFSTSDPAPTAVVAPTGIVAVRVPSPEAVQSWNLERKDRCSERVAHTVCLWGGTITMFPGVWDMWKVLQISPRVSGDGGN